ncbi:MAG: hypothetical protein ACKVS6_11985 [Planctomycetota bacterium]
MKLHTLILSFALAAFAAQPPQTQTGTTTSAPAASIHYLDEFARFLFFAVIEGCYEHGVSTEVVTSLLTPAPGTDQPAMFIYACHICSPVVDALRLYQIRPKFFKMKGEPDTFGMGLPADVTKNLTSVNMQQKQDAWELLLRGWIELRFQRMRLTPGERKVWNDGLAARREAGMNLLKLYKESEPNINTNHYKSMTRCASCDAGARENR